MSIPLCTLSALPHELQCVVASLQLTYVRLADGERGSLLEPCLT